MVPAGAPGRGPETTASPVSLVSVSESWGLSGRRKPDLGSRGLSKREVEGRGHFSKFDLVCFIKFSWLSTVYPYHSLIYASRNQALVPSALGPLSRGLGPGRWAAIPFASPPPPPTPEPHHLPSLFLSPPSWPQLPFWPSSLISAPLPSPHPRPSLAQPPLTIFPSRPSGPTPSS